MCLIVASSSFLELSNSDFSPWTSFSFLCTAFYSLRIAYKKRDDCVIMVSQAGYHLSSMMGLTLGVIFIGSEGSSCLFFEAAAMMIFSI